MMRTMLFVSHRIPWPLERGEKIRGWNLLTHLEKSWRVLYGCLIDEAKDWAHVEMLRPHCAEFAAFGIDRRWQKLRALAGLRAGRPMMLDYYRHAGLARWAAAALARERIDLAYIYSTPMDPYVPRSARVPRVLDMQDVDSAKWEDYARSSTWPMRAVWAREARTLRRFEREATEAAARTLLVSEPEAELLRTIAPAAAGRIGVLEQGVDTERFAPDLTLPSPYGDAAPRLVMVGNMDYRPNAEGAVWFARSVLPLLARRDPMPRVVIVGANPAPEVVALAALPGVVVTGRVEDVRPYVLHAAVSVAPLRMARGIQNKVLEAMAMGRPVVATEAAFEGVRAVAGRDLLVGAEAADIAQLVDAVLDGRHPTLGPMARAATVAGYGWPRALAQLDATLEAVLQENRQ